MRLKDGHEKQINFIGNTIFWQYFYAECMAMLSCAVVANFNLPITWEKPNYI